MFKSDAEDASDGYYVDLAGWLGSLREDIDS